MCSVHRREGWLNAAGLRLSLLTMQDTIHGGFAGHCGHGADLFHTHFALAALALEPGNVSELCTVDVLFCLPTTVLQRNVDRVRWLWSKSMCL